VRPVHCDRDDRAREGHSWVTGPSLAGKRERLTAFRGELEALIAGYFDPIENVIQQDCPTTRAET
jgi:hypothetical protein